MNSNNIMCGDCGAINKSIMDKTIVANQVHTGYVILVSYKTTYASHLIGHMFGKIIEEDIQKEYLLLKCFTTDNISKDGTIIGGPLKLYTITSDYITTKSYKITGAKVLKTITNKIVF